MRPGKGGLLTVAERSGWTRTSTHREVLSFLDGLLDSGLPHVDRFSMMSLGMSGEGRELPLVMVSEPPLGDLEAVRKSGKLRLLVNANIHAGEVEGKAAVQILCRELAEGRHARLLEEAVLLLVPIYNADGNDRIDRRHRVSQNGPEEGVGQRPNAAGLDLNRDFVKAEAPETRALLGAFRVLDPHLFMDLHTTDGSYHGYHLTYAPSLSTNVDPEIDRFARKVLLPGIRRAMAEKHGYRIYDYGNFKRRDPEKGWATYDHRPRYGTNYYSLRNRFAVLSEAYSHLSFEDRVAVTRAFVLETLGKMAEHAPEVKAICERADMRAVSGEELEFGYRTALEKAWEDEVLMGSVREEKVPEGVRVLAHPGFSRMRIPVQVAFRSRKKVPLPRAWAVPPEPGLSKEALELLLLHGILVEELRADSPEKAVLQRFRPQDLTRLKRPFQGHRELRLKGEHEDFEALLPKGTLLIRGRQPLARLAAQLLEARSEDSLCTWNFVEPREENGTLHPYPVLRVLALPELETVVLGRE